MELKGFQIKLVPSMAVWLSKYSCQKPLCLGGKVDALSWKCQKNRDELHLVAGSLHQLQLLLQETGFPRGRTSSLLPEAFSSAENLSGGSHVGAISLLPWTCTAWEGCFQFKQTNQRLSVEEVSSKSSISGGQKISLVQKQEDTQGALYIFTSSQDLYYLAFANKGAI